jgi:hypothetical protein
MLHNVLNSGLLNDTEIPFAIARVATGSFFALSGFHKLFNRARHRTLVNTLKDCGVPCVCSASDHVRPAFRESQRRCREGPPLALARPGLPLGLDAVADEACAERGHQHSAYAVAPVGDLVRLRVDEQRFADIETK